MSENSTQQKAVVREPVADPEAFAKQQYAEAEAELIRLSKGADHVMTPSPESDATPPAGADPNTNTDPAPTTPTGETTPPPASGETTPGASDPATQPPAVDPRDAEIASLRKRLDDAAGDFGGRLGRMEESRRADITTMTELMKRNAELMALLNSKQGEQKPPAAPKPVFDVTDDLRSIQPEIAGALERASPIIEERVGKAEMIAAQARDAAAAVENRLREIRYGQFCAAVTGKVKDYESLKDKSEFVSLAGQRRPGDVRTYGQVLNDMAAAFDQPNSAEVFVEVVEDMRAALARQAGATPQAGAQQPGAGAVKPIKPPPSAQRGVDRSLARSGSPDASAKLTRARLAEVHTKLTTDFNIPAKQHAALMDEYGVLLLADAEGKLA